MNSAQKENRLGREKSPYLLQHAHNPVDWFPWGPEAFEKAKKENKLIFLSIGYSTCHWCHVMEHESFENEQVAELLNTHYVSIKVDREERPDIDHIYMSAVQAMTGSGGWPLSLFLTPEAKPVTGGTYFPPDDKWGRAGMKTILPHLANLWKAEPDKMQAAGHQMTELLQAQPPVNEKKLSYEPVLQAAYKQFVNHFDEVHGGFGGAPKFPRTHDLSFLLRYWKRTGEAKALAMVEKTLQIMACGGIYDHLGGGFARYATDENWLVPHFEKMLYDQATLAQTYLEAYQATKKPFYAEVARDIFRYVLRDMTSPEGGFYSAEDADSEGEEGKFYVWRPEEIKAALGDRAETFSAYYNVTAQGNFEHETSILNRKPSGEIPPAEFQPLREKLFEIRKKRIPPHKDDKILTAWNGMMISALAKGAQILNEPLYAEKAAGAASFILEKLQGKGCLLRRFRAGESAIEAFQDDYAFFILALIDLYEATFEVRWLEEAVRLTGQMIQMFWDPQTGGFFYTAENAETLIARTKEYYDGATPSGNSVAAFALLRLSRMTGDGTFDDKAAKVIHSNSAGLEKYPVAYPQLLSDLDFALGPTREIVLAGRKESAEFQQLLKLVREDFFPNQVLLYHPEERDEARKIEILADFIKNQKAAEGKAAAYVCRNHACELPAADPESLKKVLGRFK